MKLSLRHAEVLCIKLGVLMVDAQTPNDLSIRFWRKLSMWSCAIGLASMLATFLLVGALDGDIPADWFLLIVSVATFVLCSVAIRKDSAKLWTRGGVRKWVKTAVTLFAVYVNIEGVLVAVDGERVRAELRDRNRVESNIRLIAVGCEIYAPNHNGLSPSSLSDLVDLGAVNVDDLRDAAHRRDNAIFIPDISPGPAAQPADDRQFVYVAAERKADSKSDQVMLYDPIMHDGLVAVGMASGQTKWVSPAEANVLLSNRTERGK
jgi:hypothetical protein